MEFVFVLCTTKWNFFFTGITTIGKLSNMIQNFKLLNFISHGGNKTVI